MATITTKKQVVLDLWDTECNPDFVEFAAPNEDEPGDSRNEIWVGRVQWEEMGKPEVITLTIEAGDTMNENPAILTPSETGGKKVKGAYEIGEKR